MISFFVTHNAGNQRLRRIVESYVEQYSSATTRQDKSDILSAIVDEVRKASPDGGFIKQDPVSERWFEVGHGISALKSLTWMTMQIVDSPAIAFQLLD